MKAKHILIALSFIACQLSFLTVSAQTFSGRTWYDYRDASLVVDGKGTLLDPVVISTPEQLAQLSWLVNEQHNAFEGKVITLAADIDLTKEVGGKRVEWVPIGISSAFKGVFLGIDTRGGSSSPSPLERHTVKGMYADVTVTNSSTYFGLFGHCDGFLGYVDIREASLKVTSTGTEWSKFPFSVGLLCGYISMTDNVSFFESVSGKRLSVLPGITSVSVEGALTVDGGDGSYIGGICGFLLKGEIAHSTADVDINNAGMGKGIGGIIGEVGWLGAVIEYECSIIDCAADVTLNSSRAIKSVGGIAGITNYVTSIKGCSSTGIMSGKLGNYTGGIVGEQGYRSQVLACTSTMSFENLALNSAVSIGGITGRLGEGEIDTMIEGCVFAGNIDGTYTMDAGGICALYGGSTDEHIMNSLFLGTLTKSTLKGSHTGAIVGSTPKPIETVSGCYYDQQLFSGDVVSGSKSELTIFALNTQQLISGDFYDVPMLPTDDSDDYGFALRAGFYPMMFFNGKSKGYDVLAKNSPTSEIGQKLFSSAVRTDNSVYQALAWLASVPVVIRQGDSADDFVSALTVSQLNAKWTETDGREVSVQSEAVLPEAPSVTIDDRTVIAREAGTYLVSINSLVSVKDKSAERPKTIDGEKRHMLNVTLGKPWDGTVATSCAAGKGTAEDHYIIKNGAQLAYAVRNNKAGEFYDMICDIVLNKDVYDDLGNVNLKESKRWVKGHWDARFDGTGHIIYGFFAFDEESSLFGDVGSRAEIGNLGVAESSFDCGGSGMLAHNVDGKIYNCFVQGILALTPPQSSISAKTFGICRSGGICATIGLNNPNALIEDCISAVFNERAYADYTPFVSLNDNNRGVIRNCLAVVPTYFANTDWTEFSFSAEGHNYIQECYWLKGYESTSTGYTLEEIGQSLGTQSRWSWTSGYFPTLKTFAESEIAKLMMVPVRTDVVLAEDTDEFNMLLGFRHHLEFSPGAAQWQMTGYNNELFIEADADMGIITPIEQSVDLTRHVEPFMRGLLGLVYLKGTLGSKSILIPMRTTSGDVSKGITFIDYHARQACLDAFDTNHNGFLSLSELKAVTNEQTLTAFQTPTARMIKTFREFRFFKSITELTSQLNGLSSLEYVQLPYALKTIGAEAFKDCNKLTEVLVSSKVEEVRPRAFYGSLVENILVDPFNEQFVSRNGVLFTKADELVCYPNGRAGQEAVVEGTVKRIAEGAFYKVPGLRRLYFDTTNFTTVPRIVSGSLVTDDDSMMDVYVSDATYDQTLLRKYQANSQWATYDRAGKLHQYFPLKFDDRYFYYGEGSCYLTTMCIGFDTQLPQELTPYTAAVVIAAPRSGVYRLMPLDGTSELEPWPLYENRLVGTDRNGMPVNQTSAAQGNVMTLEFGEGTNLGFFPEKSRFLPPYHAYLPYNTIGMDPDIAANAHYDIEFKHIEPTPEVALIDGADNSEALTKYDGKVVNVTYDRVLRAIDNGDGTWTSRAYTVCLPYNFGIYEDSEKCSASIFRLVSVTDNYEFVFTNDFSYITAGTPYVVVMNKGELRLDAQNVKLTAKPMETEYYNKVYATYQDAISEGANQVGWWRGTFRTITNEEGSAMHAFGLTNGKWKVVRNDSEQYRRCYVPTFRAFYVPLKHTGNWIYDMKYIYSESGEEVGRMTNFPTDSFDSDLLDYDDESSGVSPVIHTIDHDGTHRYYNMQGVLLPGRPSNGMYISNGKKIISK